MVWYGVAWYGMVWYGMVWYGMVCTYTYIYIYIWICLFFLFIWRTKYQEHTHILHSYACVFLALVPCKQFCGDIGASPFLAGENSMIFRSQDLINIRRDLQRITWEFHGFLPGNASHVIEKSLLYCSAIDRHRAGAAVVNRLGIFHDCSPWKNAVGAEMSCPGMTHPQTGTWCNMI